MHAQIEVRFYPVIVKTESLHTLSGKVVMVDGSFDPIHEGHIAYFQAASEFGFPVLCNIAPDSWTEKKHRVLLTQKQRLIVIDAMKCVQYVHAADLATDEILKTLKPVMYLKGSDWLDRGGIPAAEQKVCFENSIEVKYLDTILNSSSELVRKWISK